MLGRNLFHAWKPCFPLKKIRNALTTTSRTQDVIQNCWNYKTLTRNHDLELNVVYIYWIMAEISRKSHVLVFFRETRSMSCCVLSETGSIAVFLEHRRNVEHRMNAASIPMRFVDTLAWMRFNYISNTTLLALTLR